MLSPQFAIILPARYGSTRFPGKPLVNIAGRPLIEWVYRRATEVAGATDVIVATDDERIFKAVDGFGGKVTMTRADHATGTDRVAEVAQGLDSDFIVNLQGDEPVFDPQMVSDMVGMLVTDAALDMATAAHKVEDDTELRDSNVVKVVFDKRHRALYFSRSPIPSGAEGARGGNAWRHVGVYAFRREALARFTELPRAPLEKSEGLEQLRALENGMSVGVVETSARTIGVDIPEDAKIVEKVIARIYTDLVE